MLARLLVFVGVPLTLFPLVFRLAVINATATADADGFAANVDQYAHQSSPYLLTAVNVGLVVGVVPLVVGVLLLIRERMSR
ncbi:MAG: hypothetical protein RLZZ297_469 [Chloroflexota bacterium]|jgi:hypothetical protein